MRRIVPISVFAVAVVAAGCASASRQAQTQTATVVINQAADASAAVTSARVSGHLATSLTGYTPAGTTTPVTSSFSADISGEFALHPLRGEFQMNHLATDGQAMSTGFGIRYTADAIFLHMPFPPLNGKWLAMPFSTMQRFGHVNLGQLMQTAQQVSPAQYLQFLRTTGQVTRVGTQTVDGVSTVHYTGTVDPTAVLRRLAPALRTQLAQQLAGAGVHAEHIDVWIGSDNLPRRITVTASGTHLTTSMQMDYLAYNVPVQVSAPPAGDTLNIASLAATLGTAST